MCQGRRFNRSRSPASASSPNAHGRMNWKERQIRSRGRELLDRNTANTADEFAIDRYGRVVVDSFDCLAMPPPGSMVGGEDIENELGPLLLEDQACPFQLPEVRRDRRGSQLQNGRELTDAELSLFEHCQNSQPGGVRHGFDEPGQLSERRCHLSMSVREEPPPSPARELEGGIGSLAFLD